MGSNPTTAIVRLPAILIAVSLGLYIALIIDSPWATSRVADGLLIVAAIILWRTEDRQR